MSFELLCVALSSAIGSAASVWAVVRHELGPLRHRMETLEARVGSVESRLGALEAKAEK